MTLKEAAEILAAAGVDNPLGDAREIFRHIGKIPSYALVSQSASTECEAVISAIQRRAEREPLQYIVGEVEFYRESYFVSDGCLIPRADTEILVDFAVKNIPEGCGFLDLCTGSGCIAISVLNNTKNTTATAADISRAALDIARRNAKRVGVETRLDLLECDVTAGRVEGDFFAVLSNPPYVTDLAYESLAPEIYREPRCAFVGGTDGADFYRAITPLYRDAIAEGGFIAYEIGYDQGDIIKEIAAKNRMHAEIIKDLSGNDRVAVLRK